MAKSGLGCMPNSPNFGKSLETLGISKILLHITFLQGSAAVWPAKGDVKKKTESRNSSR
jgi:hypothetical protein